MSICRNCQSEFVPTKGAKGIYCSPPCQRAGSAKTRSRPIEERFWEKVDKRGPNDCWLWTGATTFGGYGVIGIGRRPLIRAHRLSYKLHVGPIADGQVIRHRCDNPPCVNPTHLLPGTLSDNTQDMLDRGRANPKRKLSDAKFKAMLAAPGTCREVAAQFGVSNSYVSMARNGRRR